MRAIGEARGASVDFGGAEAIAALSHRDYDVVVFPGGSAVQQFNSIGNGAVASVGFARFSQFFVKGRKVGRRFVDSWTMAKAIASSKLPTARKNYSKLLVVNTLRHHLSRAALKRSS